MTSNLQENPTSVVYRELTEAYDFFNRELFEGRLPPALITLTYHRRAYGFFRSKPFVQRDELEDRETWDMSMGEGADDWEAAEKAKPGVDEISLNIFQFAGRSREEILSTLCHEMTHLEQFHFGKPPKRPTHNKEWVGLMERIGLIPSDTGAPGGKKTGRNVSHYIAEGGPFERVVGDCPATLDWVGLMTQKKRKSRSSRPRYVCPECEISVKGKADLNIICGDCEVRMVPDSEPESPPPDNADEGEDS